MQNELALHRGPQFLVGHLDISLQFAGVLCLGGAFQDGAALALLGCRCQGGQDCTWFVTSSATVQTFEAACQKLLRTGGVG